MKQNKQAFTLIELLVVVLIIGILSAIALPQYQRAVSRSQIVGYLPVAKSLGQAQEIYFMTNGYYADNIQDLDINLDSCDYSTIGGDKIFACGANIQIDNCVDKVNGVRKPIGAIIERYCPGHNFSYQDCAANRSLQLEIYLPNVIKDGKAHRISDTIHCKSYNTFGESVCNSLSGIVDNINLY